MKSTKNFFTVLILFFSIGISTNLCAQSKLDEQAKKFAEKISSQMSKDLRLTDEQQKVVYQALFEKNVRAREILADKNLTAEQREEKIKENNRVYSMALREKLPEDLIKKIFKWHAADVKRKREKSPR